jgi:hypothetical protein
MQMPPDEIEMPPNVELRDFGDFDSARRDIYDRTKQALVESYPMTWGGVRVELEDVDYDGPEEYSLAEQKKALLEDKYLSRRLRGKVKMYDDKTGQLLDENQVSLMRVPYLTRRGTFIHGGNEYTSIMQARLLPGVYTRRQENGALETQFNLRQARAAFRVGFEPDTTQYRLKIGQANMHMYSLLKDLGVPDERLQKMWGDEIFQANSAKYDSRVFEKAYERLVPARQRKADASREEKAAAIQAALDEAQVNTSVMRKNLPNRFDMTKSAEWQARWAGREIMLEKIASRAHTDQFKPDLLPEDCFYAYTESLMFKCAGEEWSEVDNAGPDPDFQPDLKPDGLKEQYNNLYARMGNRLAGMRAWPKEWMPPGSNQLGWLDWYFGYMDGKRTPDDSRQVKRWKSFKARHLAQFLKNPTPRRAFALRNWAIDPMLYLDEPSGKLLQGQMEDYRGKQFQKAAAADESVGQLQLLLEAKAHSDAKRYGHKHFLINRSMTERPDEWVIDTPGGPHPGVTHLPTGFKLHMAASKIPPTIKVDSNYALPKQTVVEDPEQNEKIAAFDLGELQALAQYLNREHNAGLPINTSAPEMEQHILDFINGEGGMNPGLMQLGVEGAEEALKDVQKLNTAKTPQPEQTSVWQAATKSASAVIVKGNPKYITDNPEADEFYEALAALLKEQGYETSFDAGEPYTSPDENASLWVGHSRGQDRLQYAPEGIRTVAVDPYQDWQWEGPGGLPEGQLPPSEHYQITDALREALKSPVPTNTEEPTTKVASFDELLTKTASELEAARNRLTSRT